MERVGLWRLDRYRSTSTVSYSVRMSYTRDADGPDGIRYKKGMEGQYLGMAKGDIASIFIQGVTEGDGFSNRNFPRRYLEIGKPWQQANLQDLLSFSMDTGFRW